MCTFFRRTNSLKTGYKSLGVPFVFRVFNTHKPNVMQGKDDVVKKWTCNFQRTLYFYSEALERP